MRSTLFVIPHEIAGLPVLGLGWALIVWSLVTLGLWGWWIRKRGFTPEFWSIVPFPLMIAAAIALLLPRLELIDAKSLPIGLPIRGYGVMLMLATVSGVGISAWRAQKLGIDPEKIYELAVWMFAAGIIGARLFYVIQYSEDFKRGTIVETLQAIANIQQGGLVVFGALLAAIPAAFFLIRRYKLPFLAVADIITPGMLVGQAVGRLGCFLHGCCFGGICDIDSVAVTFPQESPPYVRHLEMGWKSGVWLDRENLTSDSTTDRVVVAKVEKNSAAERAGLKAGQQIISIGGKSLTSLDEARAQLARVRTSYEVTTSKGDVLRWTIKALPARSAPIHPTQIYSAIDAFLLALVLWNYFPFRRHDGEVFALLLIIHPISRFVLELIRADEGGQFGTSFTISQLLGFALMAAGVALLAYLELYRRGTPVFGQSLPPAKQAAGSSSAVAT